ncbi:hypothetical protein Tco_1521678, partial [Tanacetum coccineum]
IITRNLKVLSGMKIGSGVDGYDSADVMMAMRNAVYERRVRVIDLSALDFQIVGRYSYKWYRARLGPMVVWMVFPWLDPDSTVLVDPAASTSISMQNNMVGFSRRRYEIQDKATSGDGTINLLSLFEMGSGEDEERDGDHDETRLNRN